MQNSGGEQPASVAQPGSAAGTRTCRRLDYALKHAFRGPRHGNIRVEMAHADPGRVRMIVKDDGLGLPAGLDVQRSDSSGLQLVRTLAAQLEATMDVQSQGGSSFEFTFRRGD